MPRAVWSPMSTLASSVSPRLTEISPLTRVTARVTDKDKVKDQRAAPWFDPSVQFLFIFFATLNKGESHKTEAAAVLSILRGFWRLKGPHQGPLSAKPRGKSIRRAVFDVRNSTPTD